MNFQTYKQYLAQLTFGKRLPDALYIHAPCLADSFQPLEFFVNGIADKAEISSEFNIIKFFLHEFKISFLFYPDFFELPHPVLKESITVNLATGKIRKFNYTKSSNPPILHRKETILKPDHPKIPEFKKLTLEEEKQGLYENTKIIGFKKNWESLLNQKSLSYKGHSLVISKGISQKESDQGKKQKYQVQRHKTAITRYNLSKPVQTLFENSLVTHGTSFFDYGCGQGDDVLCF